MLNSLRNKSWGLFFLVSLIYSLSGSAVFSATYYVSDSIGNDANTGTSTSSPWKTLSKVNSRTFQPGDTVLFKRGDTWIKQQLKINSNGKAGQPITFAAYGTGDRPIFDGSYDQTAFYGVYVTGRSWLAFEDLYLYRHNKGFWIYGSNNVTVSNFHVSHTSGECIRIKHNSSQVTVDNTEIHNCGVTINGEGIYVGTDPAQAGGVPDRTTYVTVKNNHIYNTRDEAVELKAGTSDCTVINNRFHDITVRYNGAMHAGLWSDPVINPNHTIASNVIYNIYGDGGYGIIVASGGIKIYNNIIYNTSQYAITVRDRVNTGLIAQVYNNTSYKTLAGVQIAYYSKGDSKNNLSWANGSGNTSDDPVFVDPAAGDFRLCEGVGSPITRCPARSKAIDAGINVGLVFTGAAPDLGALESGSGTPPTPPSGVTTKIQ